jgi:hypothetical protein
VLLRQVLAERHLELDLSRLDADKSSAYRVHRFLARKACAHTTLVRRISGVESLRRSG